VLAACDARLRGQRNETGEKNLWLLLIQIGSNHCTSMKQSSVSFPFSFNFALPSLGLGARKVVKVGKKVRTHAECFGKSRLRPVLPKLQKYESERPFHTVVVASKFEEHTRIENSTFI